MDIGVVIVTFNRLKELKIALNKYENQTKKPKYIIVVNNNSNDGTKEFLEQWKSESRIFEKHVVNLSNNIGGSGGFNAGLDYALKLNCNWIWLADDDAYPNDDAFEKLNEFYKNQSNFNDIAAFCSSVINNKKYDIEHRRKIELNKFSIKEIFIEESQYNKEYFEVDLFSYVGCIINKKYLEKVGITERDYFIYYDDTEHSLRLSNEGKVICIPEVKVIHDVDLQGRNTVNWKSYYGLRNKLLMYKKHFPKKYFYFEYIKNIIKFNIRKLIYINDSYNNLMLEAIKDAKNNKLGLHEIYKPGWKYKK